MPIHHAQGLRKSQLSHTEVGTCERAYSSYIMLNAIEYFEIPDECQIELEFNNGKSGIYRCRTDVSFGNVVKEIYNKDDEIIATSMNDLVALGVTKAIVRTAHTIDLGDVIYPKVDFSSEGM